jgi:hypothetical protein
LSDISLDLGHFLNFPVAQKLKLFSSSDIDWTGLDLNCLPSKKLTLLERLVLEDCHPRVTSLICRETSALKYLRLRINVDDFDWVDNKTSEEDLIRRMAIPLTILPSLRAAHFRIFASNTNLTFSRYHDINQERPDLFKKRCETALLVKSFSPQLQHISYSPPMQFCPNWVSDLSQLLIFQVLREELQSGFHSFGQKFDLCKSLNISLLETRPVKRKREW